MLKELEDDEIEIAWMTPTLVLKKKLRAIAHAAHVNAMRRVQKRYEDMGLVPEEDSPYYTFWQELKALAEVKE